MRQQIEDMLQRQAAFNANHVDPEWLERGLDWRRAAWTEAAELIGHLGWKWWAKDERDLWQAQLEAVDIACFLFSWVLDESGGDIQLAAKRIEHGLQKPTSTIYNAHECAEQFAASVLATDRPSLSHFRSLLDALGLTTGGLYARYIGKMVLNRFRQDNGYKLGTYTKIWGGYEDNRYLQAVVEGLPEEEGVDLGQVIYAHLDNLYRELVRNAQEAA